MTRAAQVLIADDDVLVRQLLAMLVRSLGAQPVLVEDGQQALDCLARSHYALVLLDLMMPVLDGAATLARIRARWGADVLPVVMVTGHDSELVAQRLRAAGASACIGKPIDLPSTRALLRPFLS
ncbi:response regulator [Massilia sp. TS11]|uniref:response regulator n=1 Tax=Massilia sp. TS11 TaxID=2908003 RepID=UPI001EDAB44D|nr:response regulator [Massilia sp. TS11]MCG2583681.1 response regulator [Massilia sp. TS11]